MLKFIMKGIFGIVLNNGCSGNSHMHNVVEIRHGIKAQF